MKVELSNHRAQQRTWHTEDVQNMLILFSSFLIFLKGSSFLGTELNIYSIFLKFKFIHVKLIYNEMLC